MAEPAVPVEHWLREQAAMALERKDFDLCNNLNLAASYVEFLKAELETAHAALARAEASS